MKSIKKVLLVIIIVCIQLTNIYIEIAQAGVLTITVKERGREKPNYRLTIESNSGDRRTVTSSSNGRIEVNLAPGTYIIRMQSGEVKEVHISSGPKELPINIR